MAGIFHAYYTVALAPAIAACIGIGSHVLWRHRASLLASALMAFASGFTATWTFSLLGRTDWQPWLRYAVLVLGVGATLLLFAVGRLPRKVGVAVAAAALIAGLAGPTAYSLATAATPHTGSIPSAGPAGAAVGPVGPPGGGVMVVGGPTPNQLSRQNGASPGGLLSGSTSSNAITAMLSEDASSYRWAAAAVGSNSAAGYQLASELPVMAIGGFNGSDPSPTLAQFQGYVAGGDIHWFIASGGGFGAGPNAGGNASSEIATWVSENFEAQTIDGVTVYDLSVGLQ
jgi:hypothetical protein